jgi:hypothetical protein
MGLSKNTLDRSDISTYPIKLKYSASYSSSTAINYGITANRGINTSFDVDGRDFLVYKLAKQLYYNSYITGALNNSSSIWDDNLQSTAASGTFDDDFRFFPTGSGDEITVLCIPSIVFGQNISKTTFRISSANYNLIDDGNGNVIDTDNENVHVGNVLYRQGISVITNPDYRYALIEAIPTTTTTTTTSTTTSTTTVAPTTTSTTTSTTTGTPVSILWENTQLGSPYIDGDLFINDDGINIVSEYVDNTGTFNASAGSSIYSQQNSMGGTIGNYRLYVRNLTDSITLYDNTSTAGSLPATVNSYTFTAVSGKSYYVSASVSEIPTTTTTTTSTTTVAPTTTTTSTTTSTTTVAPTTTTTSTTTIAPTTSTTTSTTTAEPTTSTTTVAPTTTTTSTTTSTTTAEPTTSTTTSTTTAEPTTSTTTVAPTTTTTSTTTSTTTAEPTTSTTTTSTTGVPTTTSTTTSTTTETPTTSTTTIAPTTSTTTSTTTIAPTTTTTSTTTSTTTETPTTSTTTSTTTAGPTCCYQYEITNYYTTSKTIFYTDCNGTPSSISAPGNGLQTYINCAIEGSISFSETPCDGGSSDCIAVVQANEPCGGCVSTTTTSTTTSTTTAEPTTTTTTSTTTSTTTVETCAGCGDEINGSYSGLDFTVQTRCLDLTSAINGGEITIAYNALDRPNRFNIYELVGETLVATSNWVGSPSSTPGPWNPPGPGIGTFSFIYDNTKTYELRIDIAADTISDAWSVSITCGPVPTTTTTTTTTSTTTSTTTIAPTTTTTSTTTSTTTVEPTTTSTTTSTTTIACYEYVATADQTDIDNSDNGTVYFEYIDCDGITQTLSRGTTIPSDPICARNTGTVYILVGGNQSAAAGSLWSGGIVQCNPGGGGETP